MRSAERWVQPEHYHIVGATLSSRLHADGRGLRRSNWRHGSASRSHSYPSMKTVDGGAFTSIIEPGRRRSEYYIMKFFYIYDDVATVQIKENTIINLFNNLFIHLYHRIV